MKRLFTLLLLAGVAIVASSCNDNDDPRYLASGEGVLTVAEDNNYWLSRMVVIATDSQVNTYLLGGTNTVGLDGTFYGNGPAVKFSYEATDESTLTAQDLTIGDGTATTEYTTYIDYDADDSGDSDGSSGSGSSDDLEDAANGIDTAGFTILTSGTIVVTQVGSFYTVTIAGEDLDDNAITINYTGYIFAGFYVDLDNDTDATN